MVGLQGVHHDQQGIATAMDSMCWEMDIGVEILG
jgi:hypothetical protein